MTCIVHNWQHNIYIEIKYIVNQPIKPIFFPTKRHNLHVYNNGDVDYIPCSVYQLCDNYMKTRLLLTFTLFLLAFLAIKPYQAKADHSAGGEIIYEWISDSTYRVFFKFYRDCSGIDAYETNQLCVTNPCNPSWNQTLTLTKWQGTLPGGGDNGQMVAPGCAQYPTRCENPASPIPGYREWWYSTIVTLTGKCNFWTFSVGISARNSSTNTNNTFGGNLYIETTLNNVFFQGNSSPYFTIKPTSYVCVNNPYEYNNGAIDPNRDSLVTEVVQPQNGGCGNSGQFVNMSPGITYPNNPIPANNNFQTNPQTGQLSFTATQQGVHTLTTRVKEYRKGILVGYIMRDVQIAVLNCSAIKPKMNVKPNTITGGGYNALDGTVFGCTNQQLTFCYDITSDSPNYKLIVGDNHTQALPPASTAYYNQATDSVRGCFSWTPGATDTGLKGMIVTVKDSTCNPPGIMLYYTFSVPVYIWPPTRALKDTSICPGQTAFLAAFGGNNFVWDVVAGGAPLTTLTCSTCVQPIATPLITTKYHVVSTVNPYCNSSNKDTVTVTVLPAPLFTRHGDTITCPNNPVKLDLQPNAPAGVTYSYKWSPVTYLDNDTIPAPTSNPTGDITYYVSVKADNTICETLDTIVMNVLDGFDIFTGDTAICLGQSVDVNGTGDVRYAYTWDAPPAAKANISIPDGVITTITPGDTGRYVYVLKGQFATCLDSLQTIEIEVQPVPQVTVNDDTKVCFGDTMMLNGIINPQSYTYDLTWVPGESLDDDKIANPIFTANKVGETELMLIAKSSANCADTDKVVLTVFPAEFLTVSNDTAICPNDSVRLNLVAEGGASFTWSPDLNISNTQGLDPIVWPYTTQTYFVYGLDTNGCADTAMVRIAVKPQAVLDIPRKLELYPGQSYQVNPGGNCAYFSWFPIVGLSDSKISNPVMTPAVNTRYIVNAMTESGCMATDSIEVTVLADSKIDIPNAFAPGHGANATLKVLHLGDAKLKSFAIYNRWGVRMFETSDISKGWDGTYQGEPQPIGVYIYTIEAQTYGGKPVMQQGNVTLIR